MREREGWKEGRDIRIDRKKEREVESKGRSD
jgi:hypothetical protein